MGRLGGVLGVFWGVLRTSWSLLAPELLQEWVGVVFCFHFWKFSGSFFFWIDVQHQPLHFINTIPYTQTEPLSITSHHQILLLLREHTVMQEFVTGTICLLRLYVDSSNIASIHSVRTAKQKYNQWLHSHSFFELLSSIDTRT